MKKKVLILLTLMISSLSFSNTTDDGVIYFDDSSGDKEKSRVSDVYDKALDIREEFLSNNQNLDDFFAGNSKDVLSSLNDIYNLVNEGEEIAWTAIKAIGTTAAGVANIAGSFPTLGGIAEVGTQINQALDRILEEKRRADTLKEYLREINELRVKFDPTNIRDYQRSVKMVERINDTIRKNYLNNKSNQSSDLKALQSNVMKEIEDYTQLQETILQYNDDTSKLKNDTEYTTKQALKNIEVSLDNLLVLMNQILQIELNEKIERLDNKKEALAIQESRLKEQKERYDKMNADIKKQQEIYDMSKLGTTYTGTIYLEDRSSSSGGAK